MAVAKIGSILAGRNGNNRTIRQANQIATALSKEVEEVSFIRNSPYNLRSEKNGYVATPSPSVPSLEKNIKASGGTGTLNWDFLSHQTPLVDLCR
jgi:hypothetical protein